MEPGGDPDSEVFRRAEALAGTARDLIRLAQAAIETARRARHRSRNMRQHCSLRRDLARAVRRRD
jgi:hypothetical protein